MPYGFIEKDWKLFRSKIADWQESYMEKLNQEYIELLSAELDASERFWQLEKRIKKDKKHAGVQVEMSRSEMFFNILRLLKEKAITFDDLNDFSVELQQGVREFIK